MTPARDNAAWPELSAAEIADMATFGSERKTEGTGDLLFQAGEASYDLFVVLDGEDGSAARERRRGRKSSTTFVPGASSAS